MYQGSIQLFQQITSFIQNWGEFTLVNDGNQKRNKELVTDIYQKGCTEENDTRKHTLKYTKGKNKNARLQRQHSECANLLEASTRRCLWHILLLAQSCLCLVDAGFPRRTRTLPSQPVARRATEKQHNQGGEILLGPLTQQAQATTTALGVKKIDIWPVRFWHQHRHSRNWSTTQHVENEINTCMPHELYTFEMYLLPSEIRSRSCLSTRGGHEWSGGTRMHLKSVPHQCCRSVTRLLLLLLLWQQSMLVLWHNNKAPTMLWWKAFCQFILNIHSVNT